LWFGLLVRTGSGSALRRLQRGCGLGASMWVGCSPMAVLSLSMVGSDDVWSGNVDELIAKPG